MNKPKGYRYVDSANDDKIRRTINTWCEYKQVKILDPDGFDRNDPDLYLKYFTEEEFDKALVRCTLEPKH